MNIERVSVVFKYEKELKMTFKSAELNDPCYIHNVIDMISGCTYNIFKSALQDELIVDDDTLTELSSLIGRNENLSFAEVTADAVGITKLGKEKITPTYALLNFIGDFFAEISDEIHNEEGGLTNISKKYLLVEMIINELQKKSFFCCTNSEQKITYYNKPTRSCW